MYNKLPFWIHLEFKIESRFSPKPHNRTPLRKPPKTCIWVCTYCKTWIRWRFWETWPTYCVILNSTWIQFEFNLNSRFPKKLIIWPPLRIPLKTCIWVCTYCKSFPSWRFWANWSTYCVFCGFFEVRGIQNEFKFSKWIQNSSGNSKTQ